MSTPRTTTLPQIPSLIREYPFPEVKLPERMVWTSSSVRLFRRCKRKFFWKYILRLRPKSQDRHLMFGKAFHACLGEWYRGKRASMDKILKRTQQELDGACLAQAAYYDQDELDKMRMIVDTFSGMMKAYGNMYERDRAEWAIRRDFIEHKFSVDCGDFDYAGKIDLVVANGKYDMLVEHKTASRIQEAYIERLPLDTQVRGYIFGAQSLGLKIGKVMYDVVGKCKLRRKTNETIEEFAERVALAYASEPDKYFHREPLMFNSSDIAAFQIELHQTHQEYLNLISQCWKLFGHGTMSPRAWPPEDGYCNAYFRTCEYLNLCTVGLDRGTASIYEQGEDMHEELAEED